MASMAEIWEDLVTTTLIRMLANNALTQEEKLEWYSQMIDFLESATVKLLNIRSQGGRENLHYNVYANGDIIDDDITWLQLRKYLWNRSYKTMVIGTGKALQNNFICGLCHGHDHPRGLCPFPQLPGWNDGGLLPKCLEFPNTGPHEAPQPHQANSYLPQGCGHGQNRFRGATHLRGHS